MNGRTGLYNDGISALKPWFRDDILRVLAGAYIASAGLGERERAGFDLALASVATSFGIDPARLIETRAAPARLARTARPPDWDDGG